MKSGSPTQITEVKLDIDRPRSRRSRANLLRLVNSREWKEVLQFAHPRFGRLRVISVRVAKTWHGWHVVVCVANKIPPEDLTFLQLSLGSNVAREMLNRRRIITCNQKNWNLLYPYKISAAGDIVSEERPDVRLSRKVAALIKEFQRRKEVRKK